MRRLLLCVSMIVCARAVAHEPRTVVVIRDERGTCPSSDHVLESLRTILPDVELTDDDDGEAFPIEIADDGQGFRVTAGGTARSFSDPSRSCDERAQNAAVFITLLLRARPPAPVPAAPTPPVQPRQSVFAAQLEVAGTFDTAPVAARNSLYTGGAELRAALGWRQLYALVGVAGLAPTTLVFEGSRARLTRVPFDLGVRGRYRWGRFAASLDLELVLALQATRGLDGVARIERSRLQLGARATARIERLVTRRWAAFVGAAVEGEPYKYTLLSAATKVGTTPALWVSVLAGAILVFR